MEYYSVLKKKKIFTFEVVWMDVENVMLSETSKSEKNKYHDFTSIWHLMNKLN